MCDANRANSKRGQLVTSVEEKWVSERSGVYCKKLQSLCNIQLFQETLMKCHKSRKIEYFAGMASSSPRKFQGIRVTDYFRKKWQ